MQLSPVQSQRIHQLVQALAAAPHGGKAALYEAAAADLGVSRQTVQKWAGQQSIRPARKRRADAGTSALTEGEAKMLAALMMESHRRNDKRLKTFEDAVNMARANGMIRAEALDLETGEIRPLSISAIARAMRARGYHVDTLMRPAPAIALASRHPNHVWQIDASLCVLYYLRRSPDARANGLRAMERAEFYKNKPGNFDRIEYDRVWRYAITDHASGYIYVEYVLGAESGENLATVFINAIQKRADEPVHGVPFLAMLDPGSANTGALFRNLCRSLQVRVQINKPGNPRAKGQVEKAHDLIEKSFESGLKFAAIDSLDALNAAAARWRRWFNGTSIMARHGMTRNEAWLRITADQLRIAPETDICRELATTAPEERTVNDLLRVSYGGRSYDVSCVPDIQNRDKVLVCRNPWRPEAAQVVGVDADGREVYYVVEPVAEDGLGFAQGAPVIGEEYARHADTPAQRKAKEIEKLLMGEATLDGAGKARKGKRLAFGGAVDPWMHMEQGAALLPAYIPKRGKPLETPLPGIAAAPDAMKVPAPLRVEEERLGHVGMATRLARMVPGWSGEHYARMAQLYPAGVTEAELPEVANRLMEAPRRIAAA